MLLQPGCPATYAYDPRSSLWRFLNAFCLISLVADHHSIAHAHTSCHTQLQCCTGAIFGARSQRFSFSCGFPDSTENKSSDNQEDSPLAEQDTRLLVAKVGRSVGQTEMPTLSLCPPTHMDRCWNDAVVECYLLLECPSRLPFSIFLRRSFRTPFVSFRQLVIIQPAARVV